MAETWSPGNRYSPICWSDIRQPVLPGLIASHVDGKAVAETRACGPRPILETMTSRYFDAETLRQINTVMVLNFLRLTDRSQTKLVISDGLRLSRVTIARVIRELTELGLAKETGIAPPDDLRGGRKPVLVGLDPDQKRVMGARVGHTSIELTLSNIAGRELTRLRGKPGRKAGPELLAAMVDEALAITRTPRESVLGLMVALGRGYWETAPAPENQSPPAALLNRMLGLPVRQVDLTRARAFGECWFNHDLKEPAHFFYLDLGHTLEGLAARQGLLDDTPGEFGSCYMIPRPYGRACGDLATVRSILSGRNFLERASAQYGRAMAHRDLLRLANEGDGRAVDLFREYGYHLGCALSLVPNMGGLNRIILGGFLVRGWLYFHETMRLALDDHAASALRGRVEVKPLRNDLDSGLMGALALALDHWVYHTGLLFGGRRT